jgi:hypothetical protein
VVSGAEDLSEGTLGGDCVSRRISGLKSPVVLDIWRFDGREMLRESDGRMMGSLGGSEVIGVVGGVVKTSRSGEYGAGTSMEWDG